MSDDEGGFGDEGAYDEYDADNLDEPPPEGDESSGSEEEPEDAGDADAETEPAISRARPERPRADIMQLAGAARDAIFVADEDRVTSSRLTKTEAAAVLAARAQGIATSGVHFASGTHHDPTVIALMELYERRCPLVLRRRIGGDARGCPIYETWKVREMALPALDLPLPGSKKDFGSAEPGRA